ncbi:MAG: hypothetical protein F4174_11030 [Acidobacteria bacterium]|nr:hypothetical protein [Acidobacteriota bacterium]
MNAEVSRVASPTKLPIRAAVGVAFGFGAGLALTDRLVAGGATDWPAMGLLAWGLMVGTATGFLVGCLMMSWLKNRLTTGTIPWFLLGVALGPLCALVVHAVFWDMGSSVAGVSATTGAIGLWNGMLLGFVFENRR